MPRTCTRRIRSAALLLGGLALAGCAATAPVPDTVPEPLEWTEVDLPAGLAPSSLATIPGRLLVGGRAGTGESARPVLLGITPGGPPEPVTLRSHSPYAAVADLVSLAADEDQVVALGAAHGGAHANFRWTVWTGRATAAGLDDRPQTFETFGGQSAGSLLGVVPTDAGPVIAGSWSGRFGLDAAVWRADGTRWEREDSAGTALANQAQLQVAPRSVATDGAGMVLAGSVITFTDGVQQHAALWSSTGPGQPWSLIPLPEPGHRSEARSTRCEQRCWVSGSVDEEVALWSVAGGQASRVAGLPEVAVSPDGPGPQTVVDTGRAGVLVGGATAGTLLTTDGDGWRSFRSPAGDVRAAAVLDDRLYAVIGTDSVAALWTTGLAPTRWG